MGLFAWPAWRSISTRRPGWTGVGAWQLFRRTTLPLIARSTYISWILMFIFCIGDFQSIYLRTGGGPVSSTSTLVVLSYVTVFGDFQTGPGVFSPTDSAYWAHCRMAST
jgi:hypothetical protein